MSTSNGSQSQKQVPPVLRVSVDSQSSSAASADSVTVDGIPKAITDKGYKLGERLGSGAFSTVYRATKADMPGRVLACKKFDLTNRAHEVWREKCLKSEMKIMMRLKHPNIIKALDVIKTRKMAFIFMEFAKNGSVGEYLAKTGRPIEEKQAKKWFHDILSALAYMHSKNMAHRDIKPDNFLLDDDYKKAILSDFGFACMSIDTGRLMKGTDCGSDIYKAPEVLVLVEGHVYDAKKADMYSMGVSLFEMLNFNKPFGESVDSKEKNNNNFLKFVRKQKNKRLQYNQNVKLSGNAIKCLDLLLEPEPDRRVSAQTLLKNNWFD